MRKSQYILGRLSDEDIEWMLAFGQRHPVTPGDILIRQGHPVEDLYLILEGTFRATDDRTVNECWAVFGSLFCAGSCF